MSKAPTKTQLNKLEIDIGRTLDRIATAERVSSSRHVDNSNSRALLWFLLRQKDKLEAHQGTLAAFGVFDTDHHENQDNHNDE